MGELEVRGIDAPWLIKEIMPDGTVYWTIRVWFGPIMDGPNYYGPFGTSDEAQYFYHHRIVEGLLEFAMVELVNAPLGPPQQHPQDRALQATEKIK